MLNEREYLIAFSSFYKAAYAQDLLAGEGINASLRKLPIEIVKSCSTGVYVKGNSIDKVKEILKRYSIFHKGIYQINRGDTKRTSYTSVD